MHAHFVLAHPEADSFNAHLARAGREALEEAGWSVSLSDLYAMGFDPAERGEHFPARAAPGRFDAQAEQRHAAESGTLPAPVREELERLDGADLVVLQYPMWWHLPPAMLKGWFDRVFAYGAAYIPGFLRNPGIALVRAWPPHQPHAWYTQTPSDSGYTSRMRFERGRFAGKRALLSVTVGTARETYAHDGRSGDIDLLLWPVQFTLAYVGFSVLAPFVAYGVEAGLRYSDPAVVRARLERIVAEFRCALPDAAGRGEVSFNRMAEWGADGRILAEAPAHSAFVRHRERLDLG